MKPETPAWQPTATEDVSTENPEQRTEAARDPSEQGRPGDWTGVTEPRQESTTAMAAIRN